ncbi:MAG: MerR family transcriptional regulator [Clostridiaceae bacterium]|nr:MerR family transcriptional regulator [Clostridiaceae bacterium]
MPDVRNCKRCGRIYNYLGGIPICPICKDEDEKDFQRVKKYLYENPKATMSEVASNLEISIEKIKRFLREERLEIVGDDVIVGLECERCGKRIKTGRFCEDCNKDLALGFTKAARKLEEQVNVKSKDSPIGGGLRYLSKIVKKDEQKKKRGGK